MLNNWFWFDLKIIELVILNIFLFKVDKIVFKVFKFGYWMDKLSFFI